MTCQTACMALPSYRSGTSSTCSATLTAHDSQAPMEANGQLHNIPSCCCASFACWCGCWASCLVLFVALTLQGGHKALHKAAGDTLTWLLAPAGESAGVRLC
jgi:hypothetical protein